MDRVDIAPDIVRCLIITKILLAAWSLLSAAEWLFNLHLFRSDGLLSWKILGLRPGLIGAPPFRSHFYSESFIVSVLLSRILGGLILLLPYPNHAGPGDLAASLAILLSCLYMSWRSRFGGDGSDQMGMVVAFGVAIMSAGVAMDDASLAWCGIFALAGQATLAYFAAGAAKLASPVWREGGALLGVMQTQSYGDSFAARFARDRPGFCTFVCWLTIVTETLFPLVFILPPGLLMASLACFAAFHFSNAWFMGLNAFVWPFLATYPSVILANAAIRDWAGLA
ncbi:MAG: hypothetical protein NTAFB09_02850 [Nitrosospira sp.]